MKTRVWKPFRAWTLTLGMCVSTLACDGAESRGPAEPTAGGSGNSGGSGGAIAPAACQADCGPNLHPQSDTVISAEQAPPPLSGGTLLATRDGSLLVAADPDRDLLYFIDTAGSERRLSHLHRLPPGDEPGRLVEDAAGRIHVALRGGRAIASLGREPEAAITRRQVCDLPRGLAYDVAADALWVGCAEGRLVTLPAAPAEGVTRVHELDRDIRDVIVRDDQVFATRFRSAELLQLDASGALQQRFLPPSANTTDPKDPTGLQGTEKLLGQLTATVSWRALDLPGMGTLMLHQRARTAEVRIEQGGYALGACGPGIVQSSVTIGLESGRSVSADLAHAAVAVDAAVNPAATLLVVALPGNWNFDDQLKLYSLTGSSPLNPLAPALSDVTPPSAAGARGPTRTLSTADMPCVGSAVRLPSPTGQVTAVAFVSDSTLAVQQREPAAINFLDMRTQRTTQRIDLGQASRFDTGHDLFHARTASGVACFSCHAEAGEDSHVWTFQGIGPRRTQSLRGGVLGTEPLHWNGDMANFRTLADEVFVKRMSGEPLSDAQSDALARYLDRQPALSSRSADESAVARGRQLFESEAVGCASCHAGAKLTDNRFADVGTGGNLQVPSLLGVSFRLPLMHDGCAQTLRARFDDACGGGDRHGHTSQLSDAAVDDLVAYLASL